MFKTGDIIVNNAGPFGHVLMCLGEENDDGIGEVTFIHGTNSSNFSVGPRTLVSGDNGDFVNYWHFSPKAITAAQKAWLTEVALTIAKKTKYGKCRAFRLAVGSSEFGTGAKERLEKYAKRLLKGEATVVTTITCVEAVVLCHQLTFAMTDPQFIKKDAAHTMPRTLATYLKESAGWTVKHKPK